MSAAIAFPKEIQAATVAGNDVFASTFDGLVRVPMNGGTTVSLAMEMGFALTATDDYVFVGTDTGITRIAR